MISKEKLFKQPNYLLTKYQLEIFRQLTFYMEQNGLSQKDVAEKLGVSKSYVNQILKGKFNFTLKKLIELSLLIGKVPSIDFITVNEFLKKEDNKKQNRIIASIPDKSQMLIKVRTFVFANVSETGTLENEDFEIKDNWIAQSLN